MTDDAGATDTASTTATVGLGNQAPVADANGPYSGTAGSPVQFDGSGSSDPDGAIVSYSWDFGDGSTGTGVNPTHSYMTDGTFTVILSVTDDVGATDTDTTTATIGMGNQPPTADANGPYTGMVGMPVQLNGSGSSDPEGKPLTYAWNFGDGSVGFGESPTHTYSTAGTYNITLTVTDSVGATDSDMTAATITTVTPPPDADVNLRIDEFDVDRRHFLGKRKPTEIELEIKNRGTSDASAMATVTGTQNGVEVYRETMMVFVPDNDESREFEFPPFRPSQLGEIAWIATIEPNVDQATATTRVLPRREARDDDDDRDRDERRDRDGDNDRDRDRDTRRDRD